MTYNELAQVLESKNPKTGKLYTLTDLNVIKMQNVGTGMLEDGLFSTGDVAEERGQPGDRGEVHRRPRSQGWIYCRDHVGRRASRSTLKDGPTLAEGPPDLADERDQQAHLAEHERHRRS